MAARQTVVLAIYCSIEDSIVFFNLLNSTLILLKKTANGLKTDKIFCKVKQSVFL